MSGKPGLLTVIIPNYNYAAYIAEAIHSVFEQSYSPIELIIVDDGSTDGSLEVIDKTLSKAPDNIERSEVIRQHKNAGKLAAINVALEKSLGEYCIILDADDLLTKDYAKRCINRLIEVREHNGDVGFIYTDCYLIDEEGTQLDRGRSTAFDRRKLLTMSFIPEPAVTITQLLKDAAPYDEEIRRGTKHHKWLRIVENGWIGFHLAEPLFSYRMHGENLSGIGKRVSTELESGRRGERILSGYWPVQQKKKAQTY